MLKSKTFSLLYISFICQNFYINNCAILLDKQKITHDTYEMAINDNNEFNQFIGQIFIGEQFVKYFTKFDTTSSHHVVYDFFDKINTSDHPEDNKDSSFRKINDSLCIEKDMEGQNNQKLINKGFCSQNQEIWFYKGEEKQEAVLGLAPKLNGNSFIQQLQKNDSFIGKGILGINYQVPHESTILSTISFGHVQEDKIQGGILKIQNIGKDNWSFPIFGMQYDEKNVSIDSQPRAALIDSSVTNIQIPDKIWRNVFQEMQNLTKQGIQILEDYDSENDQVLMKINKHCEDIYSFLKPIKFQLKQKQIIINPIGYTYMISNSQKFCQIALQRLPEGVNEYRLGTQFFKSFYIVLDYDKNEIGLGLNKDLNDKQKFQYANIESISYYGGYYHQETKTEKEGTILICAIVIYCSLYYIYKHMMKKWKQKKEQIKLNKDEQKRILEEERNKNEEFDKNNNHLEEQMFRINDSQIESLLADEEINKDQISLADKNSQKE